MQVDEFYNSNGIPTYRRKVSCYHHTTVGNVDLCTLRGLYQFAVVAWVSIFLLQSASGYSRV